MHPVRSQIPVPFRQVRGFLVVLLGITAGTCRLDKLIAPPQGALLCVAPAAPDSLRDSAAIGSTSRRVNVLSIENCGGSELKWDADIKQGGSWVVVQPDSGTAGHGPPVLVVFDPSALDTGVHRAAAIITSPSVSAGLEVPLWFHVHPCRAQSIGIDDSISASLSAADCGPHRDGRYARIYGFRGSADDSVSIEVSADFSVVLTLDTTLASGSPPFAEAGDCHGRSGDACFSYQRLPLNLTYYVEVTSADPADTGAFTLRILHPRAPDKPATLDQRLNDSVTSVPAGGTVNQTSILLRAVVSDRDLGDSLHLEAEVRPITVAFTGSNVSPGPPVASGSPAWVRATGLTDKTAYHWRVRVGDNTGRFSAWDSLPGGTDFIVNVPHPPDPASALGQSKPDGTVINIGATADTDVVVLSATLTDSDPSDQLRLQVEVRPIGTAFSNTPTDSSALVSNGGIAQVKGQFGNNTNYHWQARTKDQTGLLSAWTRFGANSESATDFRVQLASVPLAPTALAQFQSDGTTAIPVGGDVTQSLSVWLQGQVSDPDAGQGVRLEVEVRPIGTAFQGTPTATSPFVANGATASITVSGLSNNTNYHWQARAVDNTNRAGAWVSFPLTPGNAESVPDFHVAQPPAQLAFTVQPTNAQAGAAIAPAIQVRAQDAAGAVVTSFTGNITLAIGTNPGGGALSGTTTVAASGGVATFSNVSINKTGTGYTLQASTPTLLRTSTTFNITPGPTTQLIFSTPPTNATAGVALAPAVVVTAQDAYANTTTFAGSVLLAIAANPGGGTLSATPNPITAVTGVATFPNVSINRTGTGYTLRASSGSLSVTSAAFNIISGPATQLSFTVPPGNTNAGAAITPAVQVSALDALGNTATAFSGNVTLAIAANPGGGTLSGTNPVAAVNGVATFSNLSINRAGNGYSLRATSGTLTAVTSATFNITAGPPQLVFTNQPTNTAAGATINGGSGGVQVTAKDALGNTVTTFTGTVTVAIGTNPGGGTLSGSATAVASLGVATFSTLSINRPGVGYTLTASATGATGGTSAPFDIAAGPASQLVFTGPPSNAAAGAAMAPPVQVTAMDALGNRATSFGGLVTITIASNPGGGILSGTPAVNAVGGIATFSNLRINRPGIGYTLRAGSPGLVPDTSTTFNVTSVATRVVLTGPPSTTQAGATIAPAVQVTARDSVGNTVVGFTGSVTVALFDNPGPGFLSGTKTVTAVQGVATFADLSINRVGNGYTLIATASGLLNDVSAPFNIIPGPPAQLVFAVQPSNTPAGTTISPPVQVRVEDAQGNPVTGYSGSVSMTITPFTGTFGAFLSGTVSQLVLAGVATFPDLSINLGGTGYRLQASSGVLVFNSALFNIF